MAGAACFVPFEEDERFVCYHPAKPVEMFHSRVEPPDCNLYLSKRLTLPEAAPMLKSYLAWLAKCEDKLMDHFRLKWDHALEDWLGNIEVYRVDITVFALDDFGATICFGTGLLPDHGIEIDFEQFEIESERLNG